MSHILLLNKGTLAHYILQIYVECDENRSLRHCHRPQLEKMTGDNGVVGIGIEKNCFIAVSQT